MMHFLCSKVEISSLSRCATCHGIDGRATTAIGTSTYPRVPNLRATATQSLSDGELHYIIENGVQMTGMPAMPGLRSPSKNDGWALVSYIRSLRSPTEEGGKLQTAWMSSAHYVGSQSCEKCHSFYLRTLEEDTHGQYRS